MKMRWSTAKIIFVLVALILTSCTGFNKVRKSNDFEYKYHKALEFYAAGKYQKSATLLADVEQYFRSTSKADSMSYYYGASLYKMGDFPASSSVFDFFRRAYIQSPLLEDVEYMYAKGLYYQSPRPERDQYNTHQAIVAINQYLSRYPSSVKRDALESNLDELVQKLWDKSYLNARLYYDIGYYNAAVTALKNAREEYPQSNHQEMMSYLVVRSHYMFAHNSVEAKRRQRYLDMLDAAYNYLSEYQQSKYQRDIDKMLAEAKLYLARFVKTQQGEATEIELTGRERKLAERNEAKALKNTRRALSKVDTRLDQPQRVRGGKRKND